MQDNWVDFKAIKSAVSMQMVLNPLASPQTRRAVLTGGRSWAASSSKDQLQP